MGNHAIHISDAEFQQTVSKPGLVLVDFWAEWCGPCRIVGPVLDQLAGEMPDKLTVAKVNVDEHGVHAQKFGVMSIPTLLLFKDGKPVDMVVGAAPKAALKQWLEGHLANGGAGREAGPEVA